MAEVVQYRLERMVGELDDLEKRGLFTHREIAEIVKQRRKFEYRLKRPCPRKEDFIAYIDYETQLDALRRLRKKSLSVRESTTEDGVRSMKDLKNKSVSDFTGAARIVRIYSTAVMRYKGDLQLWFRFLEFCRERRNGRMKKALAQLTRFHPKAPGVYIYAAAWQFNHNLNMQAARAIMYNGLRMCPTSEDLWVEYLNMEVKYKNKLNLRKVAIAEAEGTLNRSSYGDDEKQWREENQDLFISLNGERDGNDGLDAQNKPDGLLDVGFCLNVIESIYSSAIEALPSSFSLRQRFLEVLDAEKLPNSEQMQEKILSDMRRDFQTDPAYWDWLARLEIPDKEILQDMSGERVHYLVKKAVKVYDEALETAPSAMLIDIYTDFLMDIISPKGESWISNSPAEAEDYTSQILKVYEKAEAMGILTEDLACKYVSLYLQLGKVNEARELSARLCHGKLSQSIQLWVLIVTVELKFVMRINSTLKKSDQLSAFELVNNVLLKASVMEAENLWKMALKLFANSKEHFEKLVEIAFISLVKSGGSEGEFSLSSSIVNFVLQKDGIESAREMYRRFLSLPRPSIALYRTCIDLESNLASVGDKECLSRARKLYDAALATHNQNSSLWQDYHSMEIKMGTAETANAVHWRRQRALES